MDRVCASKHWVQDFASHVYHLTSADASYKHLTGHPVCSFSTCEHRSRHNISALWI
jgi:hypothetical protein